MKPTEKKAFHIGDVLSISTGYLVSPSGIGGVYEILNFMTRDSLYTHQLPRAMDECRPHILRQHPQLAGIDCSGVTPKNIDEQLAAFVAQFGETLEIETLPDEAHEFREPVEELKSMLRPDQTLIVIGKEPRG